RPDGARRRRHRPAMPHRARRHAHDPQPRRGQLPVLGGATRVGARRRGRNHGVRPGSLMAEHRLTFPASEEDIRKLRAGALAPAAGAITGSPRPAPTRTFGEGVHPPLDLTGAFLLHTAPNVRKRDDGGYDPLCIGTTTSARLVRFT